MTNDRFKQVLEDSQKTLVESLGIEFTTIEANSVIAKMPVDQRTKQRFGILHGGSSAALAETVASTAAWLNIDNVKQSAVGVELNINHLRSVKEGNVTAVAKPAKIGRKIQVWNVEILDDNSKLVAISRCTLAVIDKENA